MYSEKQETSNSFIWPDEHKHINSDSTSIIQGIDKTVKPGPHTLNVVLPNWNTSEAQSIQVSHSYSLSYGIYW